MRKYLLLFAYVLLLGAGAAQAQINSLKACAREIAIDPARAREEAAQWHALGGGAEARVCEALSLQALGAYGTTAQILTETATDDTNGIGLAFRSALLLDASEMWLDLGQSDLPRQLVMQAERLGGRSPRTVLISARAEYLDGNYETATQMARALIEGGPYNLFPKVLLLLGQLQIAQDDTAAAALSLLKVVEIAPDSWEAEQAQALIRTLPL